MNEIKILTSLELKSFYGFNKFLHSKDKREKNRYKLLASTWILLIIMICFYISVFVVALCSLGLESIVPMYLVIISSALIFIFGLFKAGYSIFSRRGYDIISSLPVKASAVTLSRFIAMYIEDLIFTFMIMLPGALTFAIIENPGFLFYVILIVGIFLIPAIPLVLCTVIGSLIMAISSRMKHKNIIQTILLVAFVIAVLIISFILPMKIENFNAEEISNITVKAIDILSKIYPPAFWIGSTMLSFNALYLFLFVFISLISVFIAVLAVAKNFNKIMQALDISSAKHDYKMSELESCGLLKTLYIREIKRYFSSSIYVTNTIIGPIMGLLMSIALLVFGLDKIKESLPQFIDVNSLAPVLFASVFCMMNTTSVSISMEGKQFFVIKSLPIPAKVLLDSKILMNLSLMLPFYVISEILLIIALKPGIIELLWMILFPLSMILLSVIFGLFVNLKIHSFDWEREETVVKQSAPAAIGGFSGMLIPLLFGVILLISPSIALPLIKLLMIVALLISAFLLYRSNNKTILSEL